MCSAALFPISLARCFSEDWRIQYFWLKQFPGAQLSLGVNLILRLLASFLLYHRCYVCRLGLTSGPQSWNVPPPRVVFPSHPSTHAHSGTSWVHTPRPGPSAEGFHQLSTNQMTAAFHQSNCQRPPNILPQTVFTAEYLTCMNCLFWTSIEEY